MKKAHELLAHLNTLRANIGKAPIKKWGETNTKLLETIRKLEAHAAAAVEGEKKVTTLVKKVKIAGNKERADKIAAKAERRATTEKPTLKAVIDELGLNAKVARAKLRKHFDNWQGESIETIREFLAPKK